MQEAAPRLSHVGLYVHDVPKMIDFYTKVLGFVVSDGAEDGRITFLSRNPSDHHQVGTLASGDGANRRVLAEEDRTIFRRDVDCLNRSKAGLDEQF